ncbi:MAG TPA: hypothetical protein VMZ52_15150 [Bryobacteraceae bacterium]|nr:hypothetical protein [Bryobacteraceae bacterium]
MKLLVLLFCAMAATAGDTLEAFGLKWSVPAAADWKVEKNGDAEILRMVNARGPVAGAPRRPTQFALADTAAYQRVTLEADVKRLGSSLIIVFAYQDAAHYNYAHLSSDKASKQPVHNGVFHVFGGERVRISPIAGPESLPSAEEWAHVKLTHDSATGIVGVTVNGAAMPSLDAVDLSLGAGKVGLGSFGETALFKNVKISGK